MTRLLQESLGGNSKTALILNCSSDLSDIEETINTLKFGERAKRIENKAVVNTEPSRLDLLIEAEKFRLKADRLERRVALLEHFIQSSKLAVPTASQLDSHRPSQLFQQVAQSACEIPEELHASQITDEGDSEEQTDSGTVVQPVDAQTAELMESLVQEYEEQVGSADQLVKIQAELQLLHKLRAEEAARTDALQQQQFDLLQETRKLLQEKQTLECSLADLVVENYALQEQVENSCTEIELLQAKVCALEAAAKRPAEPRPQLSSSMVSQIACSLVHIDSQLLTEDTASSSRGFSSTRRSFQSRADLVSTQRLISDHFDYTGCKTREAVQAGQKSVGRRATWQPEPAAAGVIVPMTISTLKTVRARAKDGELRVDGNKVRKIILVGRIVRVVGRPRFCTLDCEDSTGTVELYWQQDPVATECLWRETADAPRLAKYYRLHLVAKKLSEGSVLVVDRAELLTDLNLLTNHLLSVIHAALSIRCSPNRS